MKKIIFLMLFTIVGWQQAQAQDFTYRGVRYTATSGNTVQVAYQHELLQGAVEIPAQVSWFNGSFAQRFDVTSIGFYAFRKCSFLTSISLPSTITSIGEFAFQDCFSLTSITIPNSVTNIGDGAFYNCLVLESVTIPDSVTRIGDEAFSFCYRLRSVICNLTEPLAINASVFEYVNQAECSLTVPAGRVAAYQAANVWNEFSPIIAVCPTNFSFAGINYEVTSPTTVAVGINSSANGVVVIPATVTPACGTYDVTSINIGAFYSSAMASITIPNSVTSIGESAFSNCSALTSVTIGSSVTSIGGYAFQNCYALTSVTIPSAVESIGVAAFSNCRGLTSVTIPNSVTSIGDYAFQYCSVLTSVTIPDSVTSIGAYAFYNCSSLSSIVIPNSVVTIGYYSFAGCSSLTSFTIPNAISSIAEGTFYGCSNLESVIIPNTVTSIGDYAFIYCYGLTSVTCNATTPIYISSNVFDGVPQYTCSLTVPGASVAAYQAAAFWQYFDPITAAAEPCPQASFNFEGINYLVSGPNTVAVGNNTTASGVVVIPATVTTACGTYDVTSINSGAFYSSAMASITIPNSVTSIGEAAFIYCSGLSSVTIPDSVTSIGAYAFYNCSSLSSIVIPNSVVTIGDYSFGDCPSLTSFTIPNAISSIAEGTFYGCSNLQSVIIPNTVTSIRDYAFYNCTSLSSVTCNATTPIYISSDVFDGVPQYTCSLTVPGASVAAYQAAAFWQNFNPITAAAEPCPQASFNFEGINYLVSGPNTVAVGNNTTASGVVVIPATVTTACGTYDVTSINSGAFYSSAMASITIPNSVTSIGDFAFQYCFGLTSVMMPESVTSIGDSAFDNCSSLQSFTIPDSVKSIGIYAFQNCYALTSVTIPSAVESIGEGAFYNCRGLTSVTIPNSVTSIGDYAFIYCYGLTSVTIADSVTSIGAYAFYNCSSLSSIVIPNSVVTIGDYSFGGCRRLTSFTIPNAISSIAEGTFYDCSNLQSVIIPNTVTSIRDYAFSNCRGLTSVTVNWETPLGINSNVFARINLSAVTLNVPAGKEAIYDATAVWTAFSPIVDQNTTIWSGTAWSNGIPDATKNAIFAGNYARAAHITAASVEVNGTAIVIVPSGFNYTVSGPVTVAATASLTFENNANLIQSGTTNDNTGNITIKRNSANLKRLDYTMWSSPVTGDQTLSDFSIYTTTNRFYTYNPANDKYTGAPASNPFVLGIGYLIRMPDQKPGQLGNTTDYYRGLENLIYNGAFTGKPNNGTITLNNFTSGKYYAIGNPYPSTISADAFLNGNATDGTLYFWRKTNGVAGSAYATYTLAGGAGSNGIVPNGTIQVGQGFIVQTGAAATSLTFTNAMRTTESGSQFFKTKAATAKSRVWLSLSDAKSSLNQTMIAYMDGATIGVDAGYDGKYINDSKIALTSNIEGQEYIIQARPTFDATDLVALNFKTDVAGDYSIALDKFDGLFENGYDVYLVDAVSGKETNLKTAAYSFTAAAGVDNTRFSLKYQKTLKVDAPVFNENSVTVFRNNGVVTVNSTSKTIKTVQVYDVQGRLIAQQKNVNATKTSFNNLKTASQVLIVKVTADDNAVVSKKVIN